MTTNFSINNKLYTVDLTTLPADITLNTFIREHAGLPGTKFMCQEGGCGVCICVVSGRQPSTGKVSTWAVNSCLTLLNTCTGWEITTVEGLGNKRIGYHAIQKRLAKMNGTQCGYCTPGFVMNMYALLQSKDGKVTMDEVENAFGGNICRCTGYRPILDALKSFAVDSNIEIPAECRDIEDLTTKICPKTKGMCSGACKIPEKRPSIECKDGGRWFWPQSLVDLFKIFYHLKSDNYMLVAGNTAHGVYRRPFNVKTFIDVNGISELKQHSIVRNALVLGANLSLSEVMNIFQEASKVVGFEYCEQLWHHFDLIANVPVRNMGTLAGNLSIKHQHKEFPSDVFIAFEALDVHVVIHYGASSEKTLSLADYLKEPMEKKVIKSFVLRPYPRDKYIFDSYKVMPRAQNAHAYVNAAFLLHMDKIHQTVLSARICFGGIHPNYVHARDIEEYLAGKSFFNDEDITGLFSKLGSELRPDHVQPDASPEYRRKLAYGLLYKFAITHAPEGTVSERIISGGEILQRPLSSGKQTFENITKDYPVYQPTEKHEGIIQASGEATYANDLPVQPNQVWAAFVTAKKVGAKVLRIDASEALKIPGVVAFLGAEDIPGPNSVVSKDAYFFPENEELFATDTIKFYNQPVGVIVAETNTLANEAADLVKLKYSASNGKVLPTLKDVLNSGESQRLQHEVKSLIKELKIRDTYEYHAKGTLDMGHQYHFFMEPQTTIAVPFEGGLQVYTSTQWMDLVQIVITNLLKMKQNEVQVQVRRIGGGYGGKATRANLVACAAALAAFKLNRPVRFVQSLESIMNSIGKRWPCRADYELFAKNTGRIVALRSTFYEDAGYLANESLMAHTVHVSKNCYEFSDNFKLDGNLVITDSPTNAACRGPGSVEGIAIMENIIEHIAFEADLDPVDVRLENMIKCHKMEQMMHYFVTTSNYKERKQQISSFNEKNRWRKKGLGMAVSEYHIGYFGQYPATVAVYRGDGTVVITHGGIEMGQGLNTKISQVAAYALGIPLDLIRIESSNTINGANAMVTGGSVGSEALCVAVRKCCNTLNERLKPVKETLKDSTWQQIVQEAYVQKVNMIASDDFKPGDMDPYTVCGLCLTEIEVDILTGNYQVSRVDLLEDTGESLNPNVDVGQIEGAFIMGLGYWTSEQIVVDSTTGEVKTNRTWNYKPPGAKDIPIDFRIELLPQSQNSVGFMRSKATGEPAICLSVAVVFALQQALQSSRNDAGLKKSWIPLTAPMTPEHVVLNAGTELSMFKLC